MPSSMGPPSAKRRLPAPGASLCGLVVVALLACLTGSAFAASPGRIAGTVADLAGNALAGVAVGVDGAGNAAVTDAGGHYTLTDLTPGAYTVYFEPGPAYMPQNYGGTPYPPTWVHGPPPPYSGSTPVTVAEAATTGGVDAALADAQEITGTVTDTQGRPLSGVAVNVAGGGAGPLYSGDPSGVRTDAAGHYVLGQLEGGTYYLFFSAPGYVGQFYGGGQSYDAATAIPLYGGSNAEGIDAQLPLGGTIAGRVTDSVGHPLSSLVFAYLADGSVGGGTLTDAAGSYTIPDLASGPYRVDVHVDGLGDQWYGFPFGGGPTLNDVLEAKAPPGVGLVTVTAGATTAGVDYALPWPAFPAPPAAVPVGLAPSPSLPATDVPTTLPVSRAGAVDVPVRCAGPATCVGTASLSVATVATAASTGRSRAPQVTIGAARFRVASGRTAAVRVRLSRRGRALLRRAGGRLTAQLTVAGSGRASTATATGRLRSR
jgi:hypothetical protein